jgi:hypothetical protein
MKVLMNSKQSILIIKHDDQLYAIKDENVLQLKPIERPVVISSRMMMVMAYIAIIMIYIIIWQYRTIAALEAEMKALPTDQLLNEVAYEQTK